MRVVHLETLLKLCWSLFTGKSELPPAEDYPGVAGFLDLALAECWEREKWTDLLRDEERTPDGTGLIEWEQAGETALGEVFGVYTANKRITEDYAAVVVRLTDEGVQVVDETDGTEVWVNFRLRRPLLTGDAYDITATYLTGDQVYFTPTGGNGNLYTALESIAAGDTPSTDPTKWAVVEIPYIFQGYLVWSAYAKLLESAGQGDKALAAVAMAERYIHLEADKQFRQSAGQEPLQLRTY